MREAGAPMTIVTIRGVMLATITIMKPIILELPYRDD